MTPPTILVVDDSRVSRMLIRTIINHSNPEATVIEASNAEEALSKTQSADARHGWITARLHFAGTFPSSKNWIAHRKYSRCREAKSRGVEN